jgi:glycosyltransferase involved in cell wall biosynthesis
MKKVMISVVIPAFNEEKWLPKSLASINKQALDKSLWEVIVVDNGSTDGTAGVAKKFGARVVKETKKGITFARNKGLLAARGEIIASTDADTVLPSDWLERILRHFQEDGALMGVFGSYRLIRGDGRDYLPKEGYKILDFSSAFHLQFGKPLFLGYNYAFKKTPFLAAGGYKAILGDMDDIPTGFLVKSLGKVIFDPFLINYPSARRFEKEGFFKSSLLILADYPRLVWLQKPVWRKRENHR